MGLFRWLESFLVGMSPALSSSSSGSAAAASTASVLGLFSASATASAASSVCVSFLMCPLFLIKTRMQLEDTKAPAGAGNAAAATGRVNKSFYHGIKHAIERDGVRSLWRGFSAQLVMCCTMSVFLPLYESFSRAMCAFLDRTTLRPAETAAVTVAAKMGVTLISQPVQLVKARLQDERARVGETRYVRLHETVATVFKREGVRGFYRGLSVGLAQSMCRSVTQMLIYERVLEGVVSFRQQARPIVEPMLSLQPTTAS
jgi:solute carrier family 25 folate transporter 32